MSLDISVSPAKAPASAPDSLRSRLREMWDGVAPDWEANAAFVDARGAEVTARMLDLAAPDARRTRARARVRTGRPGVRRRCARRPRWRRRRLRRFARDDGHRRATGQCARSRRCQRPGSRSRADRRARRGVRCGAVPRGSDARRRPGACRARDPPRAEAGRTAGRSACGGPAPRTRGSAWCSTRSALSSARRCPRPGFRIRSPWTIATGSLGSYPPPAWSRSRPPSCPRPTEPPPRTSGGHEPPCSPVPWRTA